MIVVDASAVLDLILQTPAADSIEERLFASSDSLHAPHLIDVEVAQVLRRYVATDRLDEERGRQALQDQADLPLTRYRHDILLGRVWELRQILTAYDAVYVSLAEVIGAPLVTRDGRLASCRGHTAKIELL